MKMAAYGNEKYIIINEKYNIIFNIEMHNQ